MNFTPERRIVVLKKNKFVFYVLRCIVAALIVLTVNYAEFTPAYGYTMKIVNVTKDKQAVDSFCGIKAYYVLTSSDTGPYCCAFYVKRFYAALYGVEVSSINTYSGPPVVSAEGKDVKLVQVSDPQPGDIMQNLTRSHVGIVKAVKGNEVTIVEQNWKWTGSDGKIYAKKNRPISKNMAYFYRLYINGTPVAPAKKSAVSEPQDKKVYISSSYGGTNVRSLAASTAKLKVNIPYNKIFDVTKVKTASGEKWGKVCYANKNGWVKLSESTYVWGSIPKAQKDTTPPVITDVQITDVKRNSYKVVCKVSDDTKIDRVQFPVWTSYGGQDDLAADWINNLDYSGKISEDGTVTYTVKNKMHNGEYGYYYTHVYAFDKQGNSTCLAAPLTEIGFAGGINTSFSGYLVENISGKAVTAGKNAIISGYDKSENQKLKFRKQENGFYTISSVSTKKRMALKTNSDGTMSVIFRKKTGADDEYWQIYGEKGKYVLRNRISNTVLMIKNESVETGAGLAMDGQCVSKSILFTIEYKNN